MKHNRILINGLVTCTLALALVSTLTAQTAVEGTARVVRTKGPARFTTGNNVWQPLKVGDILKPGTIVQTSTEKDSFVDLVLGDGSGGSAAMPASRVENQNYTIGIPNSRSPSMSYQPAAEQNVVRIWENTALGIDKLASLQTGADNVSDTQLDLKAGRITGNVKKMAAASKYEIKLPNGVAGIRGTVYDITADGMVRVLVGSVVVAWVDPKTGNVVTQVVMGGQQYDAAGAKVSSLESSDVKVFDGVMSSLRVTGGAAVGGESALYIADKTVFPVSPVGPPFHPPGPPPVIPPGRGHRP